MSVSAEYRAWALEQLGRVMPVTARSMFGGVGVWANGMCFALMSDDVTYLKVDDSNRADFEAAGCDAFRPYGDHRSMQYYEVPADVLEDADALRPWVQRAVAVAAAAKRRKR